MSACLLQACVAADKLLLQSTYDQIGGYCDSLMEVYQSLAQVNAMIASGDMGAECASKQQHACRDLQKGLDLALAGALLSAIGFALTLFYFCPCVKCAPS
jgi:mannose/fructose/N-acetylgalactosamine-specific phosphotransferase system component IIC